MRNPPDVASIISQFSGEAFTVRTLMRMLPGTTRSSIDTYLSRMVEQGAIRRVARGVYAVPERHPVLGQLPVDPTTIANALSRDAASSLIPSGSAALHAMGLSEQVPNRSVYLSLGRSRVIEADGRTLEIRHTAPSKLRISNPRIATLVEALRELGQARITPAIVGRIKKALPPEERTILIDAIPDAPVWMQKTLRQISSLS